jgi:hypothetical protein
LLYWYCMMLFLYKLSMMMLLNNVNESQISTLLS